RRHKALLEQHLGELLARAGVASPAETAREIWLLSEGAISALLVHGDRRYAAAAGRAALTLLRHAGAASGSARRAAAGRRTR
ncbi:MAG TPA: hypothetical protein VLA02_04640, partial [Reyranella sp.]|nr:hypothetical protein [Reyranella sp.]